MWFPFIQPALSSHKIPTAYATSSGCPNLGATGICPKLPSIILLSSVGPPITFSIAGVLLHQSHTHTNRTYHTGPGDTALTVHPYFLGNSCAQTFVNESCIPFVP